MTKSKKPFTPIFSRNPPDLSWNFVFATDSKNIKYQAQSLANPNYHYYAT